IEQFRKVLARDPEDDAAWSGVLFAMNYSELFNAREIFDEHSKYGRQFAARPPIRIGAERLRSGRRLRVGYLSPDFRQHPVADFMLQILSHHDRAQFEVHCYSTAKRRDAMTLRLASMAEHWRQVESLADDQLEHALRGDQLDILV